MLDRARIIAALEALATRLRERGVEGELCLLGGTAMVLAFKARVTDMYLLEEIFDEASR